MSFSFLLLTVAALVFLITWGGVNRLQSMQQKQLDIERVKSRVGLTNDYYDDRSKQSGCGWCAFGRILGPKDPKEIEAVQTLLSRAGYRKEDAIGAYFFIKYAAVVLSALLVSVLWSWFSISPIWMIGVPAVMLLLPERILIHLGKRRLSRISLHLPDFLDMSNICMNAGLSYMVAIKRVAQELKDIHPEICHEFEFLLDQIQLGVPRTEALRQFAERNPTKDIESLVQMLIQNEKLGSSISEAINEFSRRMYSSREQSMEEKAAKTSAKMALVIMPFLMVPYLILLLGEKMVMLGRSF